MNQKNVDAKSTDNSTLSFARTAAELLTLGYGLRFRASGRSMCPTIGDGEMITVVRIAPDDVRVGDIILYDSHKAVTAHRVEKIGKMLGRVTFLRLRGDASESSDEPVLPGQILGKVMAVERRGRQIDLTSRKAKTLQRIRAHGSQIKRRLRLSAPKNAQ